MWQDTLLPFSKSVSCHEETVKHATTHICINSNPTAELDVNDVLESIRDLLKYIKNRAKNKGFPGSRWAGFWPFGTARQRLRLTDLITSLDKENLIADLRTSLKQGTN